MTEQAATTIGKYHLLARLAEGGMGEIFLARLRGVAGFEKLVVIKKLLPHLARDEHFVRMLLDEARVAARLSHPNICQVYENGAEDGQFYIAMEYLEGVSCAEILMQSRDSGRYLDPRLATGIVVQACDGMEAAHRLIGRDGNPLGLVHRDLSPSNLFVTSSGMVKVLDFGVAKSNDALAKTRTGALKGKYAYMSPEQVRGEELDRRSDVFSLGVVLWELLTTSRLFAREVDYETLTAITEQEIPSVLDARKDLPTALANVVNRALARDRDHRFESAAEFSNALQRAMAPLGGPSPAAKLGKHVTRCFPGLLAERATLIRNLTGNTPIDTDVIGELFRASKEWHREQTLEKSHGGRRVRFAAIGLVAGTALALLCVLAVRMLTDKPKEIVLYTERVAAPTAAPAPAPDPDPAPALAPTPAPDPVRKPKGIQETLSSRRQALSDCANQHVADVQSAKTVEVSLVVEPGGRVSQIELSDGLLAKPYGTCIKTVLEKTAFGKQSAHQTVKFPIYLQKRP